MYNDNRIEVCWCVKRVYSLLDYSILYFNICFILKTLFLFHMKWKMIKCWYLLLNIYAKDNVKELPENPKTMDEGISESIKVFILSFIGFIITLIIARIKTLNIEKKKEGI